MDWDFYLTVKVGGIAVFIFFGGIAVSKKLGISRAKAFFINALAAYAGYLVSTSWYIIQQVFGSDPYVFGDLFTAWDEAGAVLYGWILGGTATLVLLARHFKLNAVRYLDAVLPWLLLAQMLNRLGCFDAGCCFGSVTNFPLWVEGENGAHIHPVQLYEALFDLGLCIFLLSKKRQGMRTFLYFVSYPAARFLFEILRGDNQPALWFMTVPQVTSVLILIVVFRLKNKILL